MKRQKNLAFISLILGIVGCLTGIVIVGAAFGIAAIVLGIMSSGNSKNALEGSVLESVLLPADNRRGTVGSYP